jgi:hypothetical protein
VKGAEYACNEDRLANFKRGAALTGASPLKVAFIYASKHYDSIATFVREPERATSEPIESRFDDMINYLILMKALVHENRMPREVLTGGVPKEAHIPTLTDIAV